MNKFVNQIMNSELSEKLMEKALLLCVQIAQRRLPPPRQVSVSQDEVTFVFSGGAIRVGEHFTVELIEYTPVRALEVFTMIRGDK